MNVELVPVFDKGARTFMSKKGKEITVSQFLAHDPSDKKRYFDLVFIGSTPVVLPLGKPAKVDMISYETDPNTHQKTLKAFVPSTDK